MYLQDLTSPCLWANSKHIYILYSIWIWNNLVQNTSHKIQSVVMIFKANIVFSNIWPGIKTWSPYRIFSTNVLDRFSSIFLRFILNNLCHQKDIEFQENGQLRKLSDLWNIMTTVTVSQIRWWNQWCWKWFWIVYLGIGNRSVSVVCLFIWYKNAKNSGVYGHLRYAIT